MTTKPMLEVLRGNKQEKPPIWMMRQAGRYLPEYRDLRAVAGDFLSMAYNPEYAAEVTVQPLRRFDLDAAIIFSDILVIPHAMGQHLEFVKGQGPKLGPLNIDALRFDLDFLSPVFKALEKVRAAIPDEKTLIGFCGAPWTVACYMVEGAGSKDWAKVRAFAYQNRVAFSGLIDALTEASAAYLCAQIEAGADCVQIFDSWAGALPETEFEHWCIQPAKKIIEKVREKHPDTPIIGFPKGAGAKYARYAQETGVTALGLDTSVPLDQAAALSEVCPVQGNLDPVALLSGGDTLEQAAIRILDAMKGKPHIFNLGHGVIKETPPEHVALLIDTIKNYE